MHDQNNLYIKQTLTMPQLLHHEDTNPHLFLSGKGQIHICKFFEKLNFIMKLDQHWAS